MSIRPDNLTLDKLLQGRLFRIPDYQRAYSWETKQRRDLFGDIEKLAKEQNSERHHFMSTVVCLQTKQKEEVGADEFGIFYVVDGQQRLTTLIILLKALAKKLTTGNDIEQKESIKLKELLVKESGRLILLQTNHDSKRLFRNYLDKGEISDEEVVETQADKNMIKAFIECEEFVERQSQRLGNLILLPPGVNSQAGDKSFEQKKKIYERNRHLKFVDEVLEKEDWDLQAMVEREERLIAWAAKEWE